MDGILKALRGAVVAWTDVVSLDSERLRAAVSESRIDLASSFSCSKLIRLNSVPMSRGSYRCRSGSMAGALMIFACAGLTVGLELKGKRKTECCRYQLIDKAEISVC